MAATLSCESTHFTYTRPGSVLVVLDPGPIAQTTANMASLKSSCPSMAVARSARPAAAARPALPARRVSVASRAQYKDVAVPEVLQGLGGPFVEGADLCLLWKCPMAWGWGPRMQCAIGAAPLWPHRRHTYIFSVCLAGAMLA